MTLLTDAERQRFMDYLSSEIESSGAIIEQAEKINLPQVLIMNYRRDVVSMVIVRDRLKSVEVQTI